MDLIIKKNSVNFFYQSVFWVAVILAQNTTAVAEVAKPAPAEAAEESTIDLTNQPRPKLEIAMGGGEFYLTDYPGANESHYHFLPLPFVVYRGEHIKANRQDGWRGLFFNSETYDVDLSMDAAFPTHAGENSARAGMSDLDWMFEIGPRFVFHVHKGAMAKVDAVLAARAVFSTDGSRLDARGYDLNPYLRLRHRLLYAEPSFIQATFAGIWATSNLTRYFYDVPAEFATANRPQFRAKEGFMNSYFTLALVHALPRDFSIFAGLVKSYYADSVNRSSPLMKAIETEDYFVGLAWKVYESSEKTLSKD